jgi:hypothetical protein
MINFTDQQKINTHTNAQKTKRIFMAKKNTENDKKLADRLKGITLQQSASQQTIKDLITEGDALLKQEECKPTPSTPKPAAQAPICKSSNPYLRAKHKVLSEMHSTFRGEIEELEKTGNVDHRFYTQFVEQVAALGDKYSDEPNT